MHDDDHDQGLAHDLQTLASRMTARRQVLRWALGASAVSYLGCDIAIDGAGGSGGSGGSGAGGSGVSECSKIPEETAGPYPGDGSNGANALTMSGIVRSDIRSSFGDGSATAAGVKLTVKLQVVKVSDSCAAASGYAVYIWHCDQTGNYSLYAQSLLDENYLRGVQETGSDGSVTFTTIYPGCYSGRWPHIHFEIYPSAASISSASNKLATSQMAMPKSTSDDVYATSGYSASVQNLAQTSLTSDMVFSDGSDLQVPTMSGNVDDGYVATLVIGV